MEEPTENTETPSYSKTKLPLQLTDYMNPYKLMDSKPGHTVAVKPGKISNPPEQQKKREEVSRSYIEYDAAKREEISKRILK